MSRGPFEGRATISGIGQSEIGRRLMRDGLDLTVEAIERAVADAGLSLDDIDGVAGYPGANAPSPGFSGASVSEVQTALGIRSRWYLGAIETAAQVGPLIEACMAVALGLAQHVVVFRSVWEATAQAEGGRASVLVPGGELPPHLQYFGPYGALSGANWLGLPATRYMHDHGLTKEQLGQVALNGRRNAALNPAAIYRDPLTMEDYLSARVISTPFGLYDCDVPCDGATAVVVSRAGARALRRTPLVVESVGTGMYERPTWDQRTDVSSMAAYDAAASMWERTDLTPADVDVAQLYDGFTFLTVTWLDALGLVEHGRAGELLETGDRIALDGDLPLNTSGGQLSAGRLHGFGHLHEACVQLWGEGGARQVARPPEVAVVGAGGGPVGGCLLLSNREA